VRPPSRPPPPRHQTVLCVDDEAGALLIRKALLESTGYEVLTALNAVEGLKIFGSRAIDLVISDHLLPGVSGTDMARQMKFASPGVPILLFSGLTDPPAGVEHCDRFFHKNEGPEELLRTVAELLRYRRIHLRTGAYSAEIACDTLASFPIWHCVVQRFGSPEILSWSQERTEKAATAAGRRQLSLLNKKARKAAADS
jgi:DNA-binding response OmpR family regulator